MASTDVRLVDPNNQVVQALVDTDARKHACWATKITNPNFGFIGDDEFSMIQRSKKLNGTESGAYEAVVTLLLPLGGAGVAGDKEQEGKEVALRGASFKFQVDQISMGTEIRGRMVQQKVPWDLLTVSRKALAKWHGQMEEIGAAVQLAGWDTQADQYRTQTGVIIDGQDEDFRFGAMNPIRPPTYVLRPNGRENDSLLVADDDFSLELIEEAVSLGEQLPIPLRTFRWFGHDIYACFLHPGQAVMLERNTDYKAINLATLQGGGDIKKHPLMTGGIRPYKNVVFFVDPYMPPGTHNGLAVPSTRRAVLCGAQAACIAYGLGYGKRRYSMETKKKNYGKRIGVAMSQIYGLAASQFTAANGQKFDYGRIVLPTRSRESAVALEAVKALAA